MEFDHIVCNQFGIRVDKGPLFKLSGLLSCVWDTPCCGPGQYAVFCGGYVIVFSRWCEKSAMKRLEVVRQKFAFAVTMPIPAQVGDVQIVFFGKDETCGYCIC